MTYRGIYHLFNNSGHPQKTLDVIVTDIANAQEKKGFAIDMQPDLTKPDATVGVHYQGDRLMLDCKAQKFNFGYVVVEIYSSISYQFQ